MPTYNKRKLRSFETEEFKSKAPALSFKMARRLKIDIYDALIQEFFEAGCINAGEHMQCLVNKEKDWAENHMIKVLVKENVKLLTELFDQVLKAECAAHIGGLMGKLNCLELLYKCMLSLEYYKDYEWLLEEFSLRVNYHRIALYKDKPTVLNEISAKICYKLAMVLVRNNPSSAEALNLMEEAIVICIGQPWQADVLLEKFPHMKMHETLHFALAESLTDIYLKLAKMSTDGKHIQYYAHLALNAISPVSTLSNKKLLYAAKLENIRALAELQTPDKALLEINSIQNELLLNVSSEVTQYKYLLILAKGDAYYALKHFESALNKYRQALGICRSYDLRLEEGNCLLRIGDAALQLQLDKIITRTAFLAAKSIFTKLRNREYEKKAIYNLAKLKSQEVFSTLIRTMQSREYCNFYYLRQWKNRCKPYWTNVDLAKSSLLSPSISERSLTLTINRASIEATFDAMQATLNCPMNDVYDFSKSSMAETEHRALCLLNETMDYEF